MYTGPHVVSDQLSTSLPVRRFVANQRSRGRVVNICPSGMSDQDNSMNSDMQDSPMAAPNSAINDHFRESSKSTDLQSQQFAGDAKQAPNTPFRESSLKPPRRIQNSERRSREFLTPAEVER